MNTYEHNKNRIRSKAINWQADFNNHNYSYGELIDIQSYFKKMGKRYGLLKEFEENGII